MAFNKTLPASLLQEAVSRCMLMILPNLDQSINAMNKSQMCV